MMTSIDARVWRYLFIFIDTVTTLRQRRQDEKSGVCLYTDIDIHYVVHSLRSISFLQPTIVVILI
jgi:hypothetical protein